MPHLYQGVNFLASSLYGQYSSNGNNWCLRAPASLCVLHHARWRTIPLISYRKALLHNKLYIDEQLCWLYMHTLWPGNIVSRLERIHKASEYLGDPINQSLTHYSIFTIFFKIDISLSIFNFSSSSKHFLFIIFTALNALVCLCIHFLTSPYAPNIQYHYYKIDMLTLANAGCDFVVVFDVSSVFRYELTCA